MNINNLMKQAKQLQAEMDRKKEKLAAEEFTFSKQGLDLVFYGNRQLKSIKIHPALIDPEDPETLEDLIIVAINDAIKELDQAHETISKPGV
ncbi:YbaB/EbfC family nucleoid-associated protein [Mycoplasma iguanae]|uniref:Nucleoid-associated protein NV226_00395 n=1 Tax=Mycoplasma iguanae TaxID=292461 RepID=A0ABY5R8F3_9MOLU|nr:YbaB/EbfC family nucleoid-associated protein [Mycoplasma iguanae]UVD81768.1 YbaB/EbfC family nucleoid-associated protein [Mycoplasma iguanae]